MIYFTLGGARSGKSRHAEQLAKDYEQQGKRIIYVATAGRFDDEMVKRIEHHKQSRPTHWHTIEEQYDLAKIFAQYNDEQTVILVDCLTLWLSNLLCQEDGQFQTYKNEFLNELQTSKATVILVSNETGLGVVPMGELTRRFVDESGFLHQTIAQMADKVVFCVAGLPMVLKDN
ncbi:bifunctional adenosylcobinamide kinase/adenosylcobinamide-phosphate guanylyltransferase [Moraxella sp. FZFQ2102]|uniref:bifunctional adenosylcobinamide kinase/adenosylcobinamide-phosphate guanylyltransferase n=1 Tax=Moraxella sp. FZFQ2102 TaxID=2953752 RepID=UPI00209C1D87|nr:bifunctional adenosylcobinamide kinase/adenosylcobinamide-phosphate guanylyltransferase [Moraxella sp. FZFQ2102]USZ14212.1 bifunctional adenosylcobinamide kinase/adenosylcobinamide-phosphate guanylyltransferase [Moraxella sp. FZFQ2102]